MKTTLIEKIVIATFVIFGQLACFGQSMDVLVDIRPDIIKKEGSFETGFSIREERGEKILDQCYQAHGWGKIENLKTLSAIYYDDWSSAPESLKAFNNWPNENQKVRHDFYAFKLGFSKVQLLNGPSKNEIWGVDNKVPYKKINNRLKLIDDLNMIPTLVGKEYFMQLPYWITKVPLVNYVKDTIVNTKTYHLVYGTWKSPKANKDFDQYVYWINSKTKFLEVVQYTVRAVAPGAYGFVVFDDFKTREGITIPFIHRLGYLPTREGIIHEMKFNSFEFNPKDVKDNEIRVLGN
ncbi:DUF6503 family protein [Spongiimicrobium sp. 3-5]|uniref:DUF6503 family protein n=1 Tax=Spongiimicrobium sp. 3-5 TaxID=3332596 RepID=UPI00397E9EDB